MTSEVKQLIDETIELTGAAPPTLLGADAPVLAALQNTSIYLIGLVGGKDVGKSSLVNALVGRPVSAPTSHGPGTETVIAYAHESAVDELRQLLEREVPGRYTIIPHQVEQVRRQVLLDLPDIDSRYGDHVQITRRMLRHMLYPLWIQSIEKYADQRPQELLAAVAEGNDPANFLFCLNKADQLSPSAAEEIRMDYAGRVSRVVGLAQLPRTYLISATHPEQFNLPMLRDLLSREKPAAGVTARRALAERRQDKSLFGWIERQRLSERVQQLERMESDAEELAGSRIGLPLLDEAIPRLLDDPGQRIAMLAPAIRLRLERWPIVNAIESLLSPVLTLVQKNLAASPSGFADPDTYLNKQTVSSTVQSTFAQLHQLHPQLAPLYRDQKLWEALHADLAASELRRRFSSTIDKQRQMILDRAAGRFSALFAPLRWLLTIGAVLWFPIVQPILSVMLQNNAWDFSRQTLLVIVDVLSVTHLLQCTTFLLMWFAILWVLLRWSTHRRVSRIIDKWKSAGAEDELSLSGQTVQWVDELLEPIHRQRQRVQEIMSQAAKLREQLTGEAPAANRLALESGQA